MRPTHDDLRKRAYEYWEERGCPIGSPEIDWWRAELELSAEGQNDMANAGERQPGGTERLRQRGGQPSRRTAEQGE